MIGTEFDVVVIGGGHAGTEAACAAERIGARVLLVTGNLGALGQMSCNPAIGGVAKGTVVREIDALGGIMARAGDRARIQFRMLNRSKGPAVWAPRVQCDRHRYPEVVRELVEQHSGVRLFQGIVTGLIIRNGRVCGVRTREGVEISARNVVLTTGTFLRGRIHIGTGSGVPGGRAGDPATVELAHQMDDIGVETARFKTGTPPRIDGRSVDLARLQRQDGDEEHLRLSVWTREPLLPQRPCWIAWTTDRTRACVEDALSQSALYGGEIAGRGPRYCPSIEDKVVRFPDAERHQLFLEPEGLYTTEIYLNGLSTSLPLEVQEAVVRSVPGLEQAVITRPGYAIEYDYYPPHQLDATLRLKEMEGLYLAGQINGTTGYEEAAGQGLLAGANAALDALEKEPVVLERDEAFIGVMVDDLVTRGTDEPYRLFTSRAEFRLLLRQDNAHTRLGQIAEKAGLLTERQLEILRVRREQRAETLGWARATSLTPEEAGPALEAADTVQIAEPTRVDRLLRRPKVRIRDLLAASAAAPTLDPDAATEVENDLRYEGYLVRERERAEQVRRREHLPLPASLPYESLQTVSTEARQKLSRIRPRTIGQAARIPGVRPTDIQSLLVELRRRELVGERST